jgi:hypothetical protein
MEFSKQDIVQKHTKIIVLQYLYTESVSMQYSDRNSEGCTSIIATAKETVTVHCNQSPEHSLALF